MRGRLLVDHRSVPASIEILAFAGRPLSFGLRRDLPPKIEAEEGVINEEVRIVVIPIDGRVALMLFPVNPGEVL